LLSVPHISHFCFEKFWITQEGFSALVVQWWSHKFLGHNKAVDWKIKIKYMHMKIKAWSKNIYHTIRVRKEELTDKVCVFEEVKEDSGLLSDEIGELITSKNNYMIFIKMK
jgi:hypothetical protein